jgi:RHS repeat-associated protein
VLSAADAGGTYNMGYDKLDRLTSTQEPFGLLLTYSYDAASNRTLTQDSFGGVTSYVYDAAGRLTSEQFGGSGQTPLRLDMTYTARDQLASETRYSNLAGTVTVGYSTYGYDPVGRVTGIQHQDGSGNTLANYTYAYDLASRLASKTENGTSTTYGYDATNELTSAGSTTYGYDLAGNRNGNGYTTTAGNEMTNDGAWTYSYDAEGNVIQKSSGGANGDTWKYTYDNQNHMTSAVETANTGGTTLVYATYTYDAFGNLIEEDAWTQQSGSTTVTRFGTDGSNTWADLNGSNGLQTRYLTGDNVDQVFARVSSGGAAAWYLTDNQGSVRNLTDGSGTLKETVTYDAFGSITYDSNPTFGDRLKFAGGQVDSATGLERFDWRWYDPKRGDWTSQDPLGFAAGDANLYRYVGNGPTNATDPSGLVYQYSVQNLDGGPGVSQIQTDPLMTGIREALASSPGVCVAGPAIIYPGTPGPESQGTILPYYFDPNGPPPAQTATLLAAHVGDAYGPDERPWMTEAEMNLYKQLALARFFGRLKADPSVGMGHTETRPFGWNRHWTYMDMGGRIGPTGKPLRIGAQVISYFGVNPLVREAQLNAMRSEDPWQRLNWPFAMPRVPYGPYETWNPSSVRIFPIGGSIDRDRLYKLQQGFEKEENARFALDLLRFVPLLGTDMLIADMQDMAKVRGWEEAMATYGPVIALSFAGDVTTGMGIGRIMGLAGAMRAGGSGLTGLELTSLSGRVGPEFNPQQLERILANLERRGVTVERSGDAVAYLDRIGAGAVYLPEQGRPGVLLMRPGATRLEVAEELIHHGQAVRTGFQLPTNVSTELLAAQREVAAQDALLQIAQRLDWTQEEIAAINRAKQYWQQKLLSASR